MPKPARIRRRLPAAAAATLAALLSCAACSKPQPPETDRPPEPQADAGAAGASDATELRDSIRKPIDRARAVQGEVDDAAAKQRADVDAQSGY